MKHNIFAALCVALLLPSISGCGMNVRREIMSSSMSTSSTPHLTTAKLGSKKSPSLNEHTNAKDVADYVAYYKTHGYTITVNTQSFSPEGKVLAFRFAASRGSGAKKQVSPHA